MRVPMRALPAIFAFLTLSSVASAEGELSLTEALKTAAAHRPAIKAAQLRLRSAEATRSALGAYLPTRFEIGKGTLPDIQGGEDLLLAQPIDLFGKVGASRASGESGVKLALADLRQVQLDVQRDVIEAYSEAQSAQALLATGQSLEELANKVYEATQRRVDHGDLPPAELLRSDLERERARQTRSIREKSLIAAKTRLAGVLGIAVAGLGAVGQGSNALPPIVGDPLNRPDVQSVQADIATTSAEVRQERVGALPEFELQFRRSPWSESELYGARVQLVWSFWDHGAARERVRAAQAARSAAQSTLEDKLKLAKAEVAAAAADLEAAQVAVDSFGKLRTDALTLLQKEQRGFDLGASTLLDVLEATRALREIEEGAIEANKQLAQAQSKYLEATGTVLEPAR